MTTNIHTETRMSAMPRRVAEQPVGGPDPAWRGLYKVGGILAIVYMLDSGENQTCQVSPSSKRCLSEDKNLTGLLE